MVKHLLGIAPICFWGLFTLFATFIAYAEDIKNPIRANDIPELVSSIVNAALGIVGALALLMFVWGGFLWMTARGDEKQVKSGWDAMMWSGIGLVAVFGAYIFVRFILDALSKT